MNRAERRRLGAKKESVINIKASDVENIKRKATNDAVNIAFFMMLAIPVMILHDKYSQITRKEVDGKKREERFTDMCMDLYNSVEKGYVSINDLSKCLWEEAGVKFFKKE